MADLRLPNITAPTPEGQLQQIKSFLFQLVQELNFTLDSSEGVTTADVQNIITEQTSVLEQRVTHIEKVLRQGE